MDLKETKEDKKNKKTRLVAGFWKSVHERQLRSINNYHKAKFLHLRNTHSEGKMVNEAGGENSLLGYIKIYLLQLLSKQN